MNEPKNIPQPTSDTIDTVIGPSVKVEGDLHTEGNVTVAGVVVGSLKTTKNLRVASTAKILASVQATNAIVAGEIQGNVTVREKLDLHATAIIVGDVRAKVVTMAPGAIIHGRLAMSDKPPVIDKSNLQTKQERISLEDDRARAIKPR